MATPFALRTDQYGRVSGFHIHDSQMEEFAFSDRGATLNVRLRATSGKPITVLLKGVVEFTAAELWNGAILSDLYVWKVSAVPEASWEIPDSAWNILFAHRATKEDSPNLARKIVREHPEAQLVQFECSYGGAIAAVCDQVDLYEEEE